MRINELRSPLLQDVASRLADGEEAITIDVRDSPAFLGIYLILYSSDLILQQDSDRPHDVHFFQN